MTRYFCPDCDGGQMVLLNDDLSCDFCGGRYRWKGKSQKMKMCKVCCHKIMPYNKTGYCYRCKRGKYNTITKRWEGGIK